MYYKFSNLDNELDRMFGEAFGLSKSSKIVEENYEINQTKDGAYLFFEAPGFNKTNLKVEMEDGMLTINGKRTYEMNKEEKAKMEIKKLEKFLFNVIYNNGFTLICHENQVNNKKTSNNL